MVSSNNSEIIDKEYLYVLNYSYGRLIEITLYNRSGLDSTEDILKEYNLNIDECSWMYSDKKLELEQEVYIMNKDEVHNVLPESIT